MQQRTVTGAPGISIKAVLSDAPEAALREYVGPATINVLSALSPELLTRHNLIELSVEAAEPLEVLRRADLRTKLIQMLPLSKARELAERLAVAEKGTAIYERLNVVAAGRTAEPILMSFFGVVLPDRAPSAEEASTKKIEPAYGLFPYQVDVAERAFRALVEHPFKTVVHMPTGSGKTRTAMHIVSRFVNESPNRLVVWLAQSAELLEQAADEFERAWGSLGSFATNVYRYWGGHEPNIEEARTGFLVAGFAKLHALSRRDGNMLLRLGDRARLTISPACRCCRNCLVHSRYDRCVVRETRGCKQGVQYCWFEQGECG